MKTSRTTAALALSAALLASPAWAQKASTHQQHGGMSMSGSSMSPAMEQMHKAHEQMNQRMQQAMSTAQNEDVERSFVEMMIPHHQGAVDMAKAALPHLKDPEVRQMAEKTMQQNQKEIEELRKLQQKHR